MMRWGDGGFFWLCIIVLDFVVTGLISYWIVMIPLLPDKHWSFKLLGWSTFYKEISGRWRTDSFVFVYPAFFTSTWLWLYAGSGFLLKSLGYLDSGFKRFNRICNIEKKPLSAIGLVAGSLVALLYWSWAAFRHFVPA